MDAAHTPGHALLVYKKSPLCDRTTHPHLRTPVDATVLSLNQVMKKVRIFKNHYRPSQNGYYLRNYAHAAGGLHAPFWKCRQSASLQLLQNLNLRERNSSFLKYKCQLTVYG